MAYSGTIKKLTTQPCFLATLANNLTNVTGDGTQYNIIFDTSTLDQTSSYSTSNGAFTAPITGNYLFVSTIKIANLGVAHTSAIFRLTNTTRNYRAFNLNPVIIMVSNTLALSMYAIMRMNRNDTTQSQIIVSNSTKTVTVESGNSFFSGCLLC